MSVFEQEERAEQGAYNQALFREVNERISALVDDPRIATEFGSVRPDPARVCEAGGGVAEGVPPTVEALEGLIAACDRALGRLLDPGLPAGIDPALVQHVRDARARADADLGLLRGDVP